MVRVGWFAGVMLLSGCNGDGAGKGDSGAGAADDSGGGGGGSNWRPAGEGYAYFIDGVAANSVLVVELTRCIDPEAGTAYYGWISRGGADAVALGEITCVSGEVQFAGEIGVNALELGYDTFDAWASPDGTATGTALWHGQVDPALLATVTELVVADTSTRDGEGSLRSLKSQTEEYIVWAAAVVAETLDVEPAQGQAEALANAVGGTSGDFDADGEVSTIDGSFPLLGDAGYVPLILADVAAVSSGVDPNDPIKEFANNAYDCVQRAESNADDAVQSALVGTVCGAESTCDASLNDAIDSLGNALVGEDLDGSGAIDPLTEGTTDCALYYVAQMMRMSVGTP